jgi:hypothetical protein
VDIPHPLSSRTIPSLSYQLLTAITHKDWTAIVTWPTHSPINYSSLHWLTELKVKVMLRPTISRCQAYDQNFITVTQLRVCWCWALSLTRERSAVNNCCWSSPAQSFWGPSPAGLVTIIYCLRFKAPPTWRARSPCLYPPRTTWPSYTPRHWIPFSSLPTTRRATVEVFEPAYKRFNSQLSLNSILVLVRTSQETH